MNRYEVSVTAVFVISGEFDIGAAAEIAAAKLRQVAGEPPLITEIHVSRRRPASDGVAEEAQ